MILKTVVGCEMGSSLGVLVGGVLLVVERVTSCDLREMCWVAAEVRMGAALAARLAGIVDRVCIDTGQVSL